MMRKADPSPEPGKAEATKAETGGWFSGRRMRHGRPDSAAAKPAPPPPLRKARQSGLIGLFSGLMTVGLFAILALTAAFIIGNREFDTAGPLGVDKTVYIEKGASTEEIVELLDREGVINRPNWLWLALLYRDIRAKFPSEDGDSKQAKAGEYLFKQNASMREVLETITSGRSIQHAITIPEGLTSEQIVERLKENDLLTGEIANIPPEGSLLPDTYRINRGTSREALLNRMQAEQKKVLAAIWARRAKDLPLKAPRDLVTLASIVEKETGRADERPRIAGVFFNRLGRNMSLDSDPTIIYGLVGGKGSLGRGLLASEIRKPTPYNTYVIKGLPPGPIANPGRAAMEASANPSKVKDIFFVADGTGGHVFAETLEQHNRNVERWRQIEAAARAASPPAPSNADAAPSPPKAQLEAGDSRVAAEPAGRLPANTLGFTAPARRVTGETIIAPPTSSRVVPLAP